MTPGTYFLPGTHFLSTVALVCLLSRTAKVMLSVTVPKITLA